MFNVLKVRKREDKKAQQTLSHALFFPFSPTGPHDGLPERTNEVVYDPSHQGESHTQEEPSSLGLSDTLPRLN